MTDDLDSRIQPDRELNNDDCVTVWAQAIRKAVADATDAPVAGFDCVAPSETDQQEARSWLLNPSISLAVACGSTGIDMGALNKWARDRAASNWRVH